MKFSFCCCKDREKNEIFCFHIEFAQRIFIVFRVGGTWKEAIVPFIIFSIKIILSHFAIESKSILIMWNVYVRDWETIHWSPRSFESLKTFYFEKKTCMMQCLKCVVLWIEMLRFCIFRLMCIVRMDFCHKIQVKSVYSYEYM